VIREFDSFSDFQDAISEAQISIDLSALTSLNINFCEEYKEFVIINLKSFSRGEVSSAEVETNNLMILGKKDCYFYSSEGISKRFKPFKSALSKPNGEATILFLAAFQKVLENYTEEFKKINVSVSSLDEKFITQSKEVEELEEHSSNLRKLGNLVDDFKDIIEDVKEGRLHFFDPSLAEYDYDLAAARTQHLRDRCRTLRRQISDLKHEKDISSTIQLNKNIERLTIIMAIFTVVALIISVPNTVATFFGITKVAEEFSVEAIYRIFFISLIITTVLSYYYWSKWNSL